MDHIVSQTPLERMATVDDSFARSLEFIINQPEDMDVNEILYRPTKQQL